MIGANLKGANLCEANLEGASLREAYLSDANLSGADLRKANLSDADLREAKLSRADLGEADLSGANLRKANLSGADLWGAILSGADLRGANLCGANLRGANLCGAKLDWDAIPLVPNIDAAILAVIEAGGQLDMNTWHTCETTHSWAGWAVVLAGEQGRKLEEQLGTNVVAALIYTKSGFRVPNWFASNEEALADIKDRVQQQLMASQSATPAAVRMAIG